MNIKEHIKLLWDNRSLIKAAKINLIFVLILLFVNVSLVSIPNYYGVLNGIRSIEYLEDIDETFKLFYEQEIPCEIDQTYTFSCSEPIDGVYGSYQVYYQETISTENITESSIIFGSKNIIILYIDQEDMVYELAGDYRLLEAFDFSSIKDQPHQYETLDAHYESVTDVFLSNVYFSSVGERVFLIFSTQFAQIAIYVVIISIMFMILNYRSKTPKISYLAAVKITILAMLGPALLSAIVGVFLNVWGSILFTLLYAIRMMFVYYAVHRTVEVIR
ncbi:MAG: hypothetical protein ACNA7K_05970 [Acholeplasmataceae bacterium]